VTGGAIEQSLGHRRGRRTARRVRRHDERQHRHTFADVARVLPVLRKIERGAADHHAADGRLLAHGGCEPTRPKPCWDSWPSPIDVPQATSTGSAQYGYQGSPGSAWDTTVRSHHSRRGSEQVRDVPATPDCPGSVRSPRSFSSDATRRSQWPRRAGGHEERNHDRGGVYAERLTAERELFCQFYFAGGRIGLRCRVRCADGPRRFEAAMRMRGPTTASPRTERIGGQIELRQDCW
jgi:hypothetical protein